MPTTIIQPPSEDGAMNAGDPTLVLNGGVQEMEIGQSGTSTLRANVGFDLSSIPPGSRLISALLELYLHWIVADADNTIQVFRVLRNWVEGQMTWNVYATASNWQTAGCAGALDRESVVIGATTIPAGAPLGWKSWTLDPAALEAMIAGSFTNNGFHLRSTNENNRDHRFYGKEYATADGHPERAPKLTIVWTPPLGRLPAYIVDGLQGGVLLKSQLDGSANKIWARYTPSGGALSRSTVYQDAAAQAQYGIKEQPLSGGGSSATVANQITATFLEFASSPLLPDIILSPGVIIRDTLGNIVPPEEMRPNRWVLVENVMSVHGKIYPSLITDPTALFIEEVEYNERYGTGLTGTRDRFAAALVGKLSGRSGGA